MSTVEWRKNGGVSTQAQDAAAFDLTRTEAKEPRGAFMKPHVIPASSDARLGRVECQLG